jgi:hypothetical protein
MTLVSGGKIALPWVTGRPFSYKKITFSPSAIDKASQTKKNAANRETRRIKESIN